MEPEFDISPAMSGEVQLESFEGFGGRTMVAWYEEEAGEGDGRDESDSAFRVKVERGSVLDDLDAIAMMEREDSDDNFHSDIKVVLHSLLRLS